MTVVMRKSGGILNVGAEVEVVIGIKVIVSVLK